VAADAFWDADPGDVLTLRACLDGGQPLPSWLRFDARYQRFRGKTPDDYHETLEIIVIASDVDGTEARSSFVLREHG